MTNASTLNKFGVGPIKTDTLWEVIVYQKKILAECKTITFFNMGTSAITIDTVFTLAPGQTLVFLGDLFELNIHQYNVSFAAGGINNCVVARQIYVQ